MASTKRELEISDEPESKKPTVSESSKCDQRVALNPADCDLDFNIEGNGLQGSGLHEQGFAYCWAGARANVGITGGKYCFGCKIISEQSVVMEDTPLYQQHVCRLGISRGDDSVGNLGETERSFGYGGTGKFSMARKFSEYGEKFGVGDTIICAVDLESEQMASIGFCKNGKWLGIARHFNAGPNGLGVVDSAIKKLQWESVLFPHVLLKNVVVQLQFSTEDGLVPEEGYKPWACALDAGHAIMGPTFLNPRECELTMMVGLPASGKTTWAEKWVKEHPEKRYILLGTNLALEQMKVPGLLRKHNYGERFDRLMDRATGIFNTWLSRAASTPRNFIIDQTNVYKSARKRKLKPFANYRKIAVVTFPKPEELKCRAAKRFQEMGKEVPAEAVNEMLANYVLPVSKGMPGADEFFDEVVFTELDREESRRYLDEMKMDLKFKRGVSPYSRESSVQSHDSYSTQYSHESSAGPYYRPPLQYPRESCMLSYNTPSLQNQGSLPGPHGYLPSSFPSQPQARAPYENYKCPSDSIPRDYNPYGRYPGYGPPMGNVNETRISTPGGLSDPCQTYGVGDSYILSNTDSRSFIGAGAAATYQRDMVEPYSGTPYSYNTHGGYASVPGGPRGDMSPSMFPPFTSPRGSPRGTPILRPSYRSFPTGMQHPGGYTPPRPGFY